MPSKAMTDLMRAMAYLRREKRRCERRLGDLQALLAAAQRGPQEGKPGHHDRSTRGWTEEKRQAVSSRMRAYWAARRDAAHLDEGCNERALRTPPGRAQLSPVSR